MRHLSGHGADTMDLTVKMIEAGVEALGDFDPSQDGPANAVERVYVAMENSKNSESAYHRAFPEPSEYERAAHTIVRQKGARLPDG